jgi:rRNA maturation protein Nop10
MWNWTKEQAGPIAAIATVLIVLTGLIQFGVINPMHQRFDAINQRFDAQDKRVDDLKAEMNQRFDAVDRRFDAQDKYINQRFDAQDKYINQRFDAQDKHIEDLAKGVSDLRKLGERVSRNEGEIDVIRQQLQTADVPSP